MPKAINQLKIAWIINNHMKSSTIWLTSMTSEFIIL